MTGTPAAGRSPTGESTPLSVVGVCEALLVAGVIDLAFRVWAAGRRLAGRPVPKGILGRS